MDSVDQVPGDQVRATNVPVVGPSETIEGAVSPPETADSVVTSPAVQALVVAHDPGPWFIDVLRSLGAQDYPRLSVLVVDAASAKPLEPLVGRHLASAEVRRLDVDLGGSGPRSRP